MCSLTWWSSPWCRLAPSAPRWRIEAATATTPSRSVGGAMQRRGAGGGEQRLGHAGTGGGFIWERGTRMAWRARHRHRNGGSPDSGESCPRRTAPGLGWAPRAGSRPGWRVGVVGMG
jgi:hypothetical protein